MKRRALQNVDAMDGVKRTVNIEMISESDVFLVGLIFRKPQNIIYITISNNGSSVHRSQSFVSVFNDTNVFFQVSKNAQREQIAIRRLCAGTIQMVQ